MLIIESLLCICRMRIAVIGGGIVGLYTGYIALMKGLEVDIFEKEKHLGSGSSGHNAGVIHILQTPFNSIKGRLTLIGNKLHRVYSRNIGYRMVRVEAYLLSRSYIHKLMDPFLIRYMSKYGISVDKVDVKYLRERYRFLNNKLKTGIRVDGYYVVDPNEVLEKISRAIGEMGGHIHYGEEISEIDIDDEKVFIKGSEYDYAVISAGSETAKLAQLVGIEPPIQRFARGAMVKVNYFSDSILAEFKVFTRNKYTKGGGIIPTPSMDANILGPGFRWVDDPLDTGVSDAEVEELLNRFRRIVDIDLDPYEVFSGVRIINYPDDDYKWIKKGPVIAVFGIDSPGFTAAPAIGEEIINLLTQPTQ